MRIHYKGGEYSELLEAAGVDPVRELRNRKPANLHIAMSKANGKRKLVWQLPNSAQGGKWVAYDNTDLPILTLSVMIILTINADWQNVPTKKKDALKK